METTYTVMKMGMRGVINTSDLFIHQKIRYIPVKKEREKLINQKVMKIYIINLYTIKFRNGKVFRNIKNF